HTRLVSDWSSDVCSSDLAGIAVFFISDAAQGFVQTNHVLLGMVGGLQVQLIELLFQSLILAKRYGQRGAQRNAVRVEYRELLLYALHDGAEGQALAPRNTNSRRRVGVALDLYELIPRVGA